MKYLKKFRLFENSYNFKSFTLSYGSSGEIINTIVELEEKFSECIMPENAGKKMEKEYAEQIAKKVIGEVMELVIAKEENLIKENVCGFYLHLVPFGKSSQSVQVGCEKDKKGNWNVTMEQSDDFDYEGELVGKGFSEVTIEVKEQCGIKELLETIKKAYDEKSGW